MDSRGAAQRAHGVVSDAIGTSDVIDSNDLTKRLVAARVLEAIATAGFAVVELPSDTKPFRVDAEGDVWDDDSSENYSPLEAHILASRLLAAAAKAEEITNG